MPALTATSAPDPEPNRRDGASPGDIRSSGRIPSLGAYTRDGHGQVVSNDLRPQCVSAPPAPAYDRLTRAFLSRISVDPEPMTCLPRPLAAARQPRRGRAWRG